MTELDELHFSWTALAAAVTSSFHSLRSRLMISPWVSTWKAAFLGALAIDGFLATGAVFPGTVDAALDDACAGCELEDGTDYLELAID